jgi:hypothetical protein
LARRFGFTDSGTADTVQMMLDMQVATELVESELREMGEFEAKE